MASPAASPLYAIVWSRGHFHRLVLLLIALTAFLSMWVLNTATAAMLIPVALSIAQQLSNETDARKFLAVLVLAIGYGASIGGIGTPWAAAKMPSPLANSPRPWTSTFSVARLRPAHGGGPGAAHLVDADRGLSRPQRQA